LAGLVVFEMIMMLKKYQQQNLLLKDAEIVSHLMHLQDAVSRVSVNSYIFYAVVNY
jgi:hypothetical protein